MTLTHEAVSAARDADEAAFAAAISGFDTPTRPQLRIATVGSVDDGKSTLIGRLLHDTKTIFEDQLAAVGRASKRYGDGELNLALLTDGLRAEREQGITIDVAYRYFATPSRSFVLADTPGHAQYTRNMVTGASVSDVAIVLIDARHGVVEQTRRHLAIAALLRVSHLVVAVNKMDLVNWSEARFATIAGDVAALATALDPAIIVHALPVSALHGDNIVEASQHTPWYSGESLLDLLEDLDVTPREDVGARLGVQWVIRPHRGSDYRGFAGRLTGGVLAEGDEVVVLPSGHRTRVTSIHRAGEPACLAIPGDAISVELADQVDVGRGDVLVAAGAQTMPVVATRLLADVSWFVERPLVAGSTWIAKHGTRQVRLSVDSIDHELDIDSMATRPAHEIGLNGIGRVHLTLSMPLAVDRYLDHRDGGRIVLVDEATNMTAGALMVREAHA
jgi:sulfate adenylyltransferase subunit 1